MIKYADKKQLNIKQLSKYTGYSQGTIRNYCSWGEIPYTNPTGGKLLFDKAVIDEWVKGRRKNDKRKKEVKPTIQVSLNETKKEVQEHTYIGMVDTVYGSDGELHICQGNRSVTFDATDLFHWLDAIVSTTIRERKDSDSLILENIKNALQEDN